MQIVKGSGAGPDQSAPGLFVVSPVPIEEAGHFSDQFAGGPAKSRDLAAYLATFAEAQGAGFFDAGTVAQVDPTDGIHLTAEGQIAIGTALENPVRTALEEQS